MDSLLSLKFSKSSQFKNMNISIALNEIIKKNENAPLKAEHGQKWKLYLNKIAIKHTYRHRE